MEVRQQKSWIDWDRIIAIQQFMTAAYFLPILLKMMYDVVLGTAGLDLRLYTIACFLTSLNVIAGWQLLEKSRLGYILSLINFCGQIFSINTVAIAFSYHGIVWSIIGQELNAANLVLAMKSGSAAMNFTVGKIEGDAMVAFDVLALAAAIYLFRKLWRFKVK